MYPSDDEASSVNPFQQVAHGAGRHVRNPVPLASMPELLEALIAQLGQNVIGPGAGVHVRIHRVRVIVADPATLRAAGLHRRLGAAAARFVDDQEDGNV